MIYRGVEVNTGRGRASVLTTKPHKPEYWDAYNMRTVERAMKVIDAGLDAGLQVIDGRMAVTDDFVLEHLPLSHRDQKKNSQKW